MSASSLFNKEPKPQELDRHFGGRRLHVWYGYVKVTAVQGWVDNPRINLEAKKMKEIVGDRPLTQDEVFEIMKNDPQVKLKTLRDDILKNQLKEPIILAKSGRLLDGNRRYFAMRYLLESMDSNDPNRADYESIPAYVLSDSTTTEDEILVLVEENFSPSLKQEWPDYVKSVFIRKDWEDGISPADIARRYSWSKRKVSETINIIKLIDDFMAFAEEDVDLEDEWGGGLGLTENEAEKIAADNYQYFNEAQKSFRNQLESDVTFKINFFKWIANRKFASFPEVRIAYEAWCDPEARSILLADAPTAAKDAKAVIDYKKRIVKGRDEASARIDEFVKFLECMSAAEIQGLPKGTVTKLKNALSMIEGMATSTKSK